MLKFWFTDHLSKSRWSFVRVSALLGRDVALDPWDVVGLRTTSQLLECPEEVWSAWRALLLCKQELAVVREAVDFGPCVSAEALKACALIGLHMIAEEVASLSLDGHSPEWGGNVEVWRSKEPSLERRRWWTESEYTSSCELYEHNAESRALEVIEERVVRRNGFSLSLLRIESLRRQD